MIPARKTPPRPALVWTYPSLSRDLGGAADAAHREPHQTAADHATYLATGERADAAAVADTYLTTIHAPERSAP